MELRNRTTGAVITESQFRNDNRNTSFPKVLTPEIIDSFGYDPVLEGPQAQTTPPYEISVRNGVEEVNGQWFTKYIAGPVFTDYTDDEDVVHTAAEQEAAYRQGLDDEQAKDIREDRNKRLADCDWTQLPDSFGNRQAWQIYRQALRNISDQDGFPWDVTWPEEPAADGGPDHNTFYNGLLISSVYQVIRTQAMQSLPLTVACTEFVAAIADAKLGIPNPQALQACIDNIVETATLVEAELDQLRNLLIVSGMADIYTIP
jgi:hypothetical protein